MSMTLFSFASALSHFREPLRRASQHATSRQGDAMYITLGHADFRCAAACLFIEESRRARFSLRCAALSAPARAAALYIMIDFATFAGHYYARRTLSHSRAAKFLATAAGRKAIDDILLAMPLHSRPAFQPRIAIGFHAIECNTRIHFNILISV